MRRPVKIGIGDGRYVDAEEVMRLFSFPRAEAPEELAKIKAKTSPAPEPDSELRVDRVIPLMKENAGFSLHMR